LRIAASTAGAARDGVPADATQGEALLRRRGLTGLREALARDGASDSAWAHFWRGYALQFEDLGRARAAWLAAEARFAEQDDAAGLDAAACGLIQCTLLDTQSFADFDRRAERVARLDAGTACTPLALFRLAARLLLLTERREDIEGAGVPIEHAFAALGADIDREIALRVATAALALLALMLDRVRSDDFLNAGAALAASPHIAPHNAALWHLVAVEALSYDASRATMLNAALDTAERLAREHGLRAFLARAHIIRAAIALGRGDTAVGGVSLRAAHPLLDPAHPPDYWAFHYYSSRRALMCGEPEEAWEHAKLSYSRLVDARVSESRTTPVLMQQGFVLVALGRLDDAAAAFERAGALSRGAQATPCLVHVHLARALQHWRRAERDDARAEIVAAFVQARSIELTHFFRALPRVAAELCGAALELDADAAFARKAIAARALACPDLGIAAWPWPLRVRTLGGFAIERDGAPVKFARKAPKRLLDLLRLVTALGARNVDAGRVAATLWPDADGDEARDALKTMLHRTRALLGADLVIVRDGQISFDPGVTWVDTWALDHVCGRIESMLAGGPAGQQADDGELAKRREQLLSLYRGHFFGEAELPSWALPLRDRLRARFIRAVDALGQRLEHAGRPEQAIALYRAALEQDNLAEELYQRLIACHLARGERAQALNAYRRCRELLSIVLGVPPSARTEALVSGMTGR
jgi:DNA-binding SARP family transcriptional activator